MHCGGEHRGQEVRRAARCRSRPAHASNRAVRRSAHSAPQARRETHSCCAHRRSRTRGRTCPRAGRPARESAPRARHPAPSGKAAATAPSRRCARAGRVTLSRLARIMCAVASCRRPCASLAISSMKSSCTPSAAGDLEHLAQLCVVDAAVDERHHGGKARRLARKLGVRRQHVQRLVVRRREALKIQRRFQAEDVARCRGNAGAVGVGRGAARGRNGKHGRQDDLRLVWRGGDVHGRTRGMRRSTPP